MTSQLEVLAGILVHAVLPKLDIAFFAQRTLLDELAFLAQQILDSDAAVVEDLEVVADDVAVAATRASDED